jgi:hypothetical protein
MANPLDPRTPDQERLRELTLRIRKMMEDEGLGGVCVLVSQESAEWLSIVPSWSGVQFEEKGVRVKLRQNEPDLAAATMHYIGTVRDICRDYGSAMSQLWDHVTTEIKKHGGAVTHTPFAGVGHGPSNKDQN